MGNVAMILVINIKPTIYCTPHFLGELRPGSGSVPEEQQALAGSRNEKRHLRLADRTEPG